MKTLLITIFALWGSSFSPHPLSGDFIDPTGTYILKGDLNGNRITGHSGEIRVQLLTTRTVALSFFISKGYPGYESGSFTDTLAYDENIATYRPVNDSDCNILFLFDRKNAEIQQVYKDPHCTCGFEKGILVSTIFEKYSSSPPIIQDLSLHGLSAN
jgi:hypothetical protein